MFIIIATNLRALLKCGSEIPIAWPWRQFSFLLSHSKVKWNYEAERIC